MGRAKRIYISLFGRDSLQCQARLDKYKGLWYQINRETIDLTSRFYNQELKTTLKLIPYYNKILNTSKFEAYIKKELSLDIFAFLKKLHIIRLSSSNEAIMVDKNPLNTFVVKYMEDKYTISYKIRWGLAVFRPLLLLGYYGWLIIEFMRRWVVINRPKQDYKVAKEVVSGFSNKTYRDDLILDNTRFKTKDLLLLELIDESGQQRSQASKEAKKRGFDIASLPKLKININKNILDILFFYFSVPARSWLRLLVDKQGYLFYYVLLFHKKCFPVELLMNLYNIKCHISTKDWGGVEETIILNKYSTKNIIFHWSDATFYEAHDLAFAAHNIYFAWGDIHYDYHSANYFVDKKINIGCIYKEEHNRAYSNRGAITSRIVGFRPERKTVTFCDTSFGESIQYTAYFFLEYLRIIRDFSEMNPDINVVLKQKMRRARILSALGAYIEEYEKLWKELTGFNNFIYIDSLQWSIEEIIAISDVVVSMGMNTPSTIALICGKNSLYFDNTGNRYHPFAKRYKDILVFEDKELLFKQIKSILDGKINCRDIVSEQEVRAYDAFDDDKAVERLRNNLYELTLK